MTFFKNLLLFFAIFLFSAGTGMAIPQPPQGYEVNDDVDFWQITDQPTNLTETGFFQIQVELASYESGFGLYTDVQPASVPEPSTILLFGVGLAGVAAITRRKLYSSD